MKDQCLERCLNGYYPETRPQNGRLCLPCHYTCATCSGPSDSACTECFHGSVVKDGQCVLGK